MEVLGPQTLDSVEDGLGFYFRPLRLQLPTLEEVK